MRDSHLVLCLVLLKMRSVSDYYGFGVVVHMFNYILKSLAKYKSIHSIMQVVSAHPIKGFLWV